jgi:D-sedoheptulose 7-phosphate isomerase
MNFQNFFQAGGKMSFIKQHLNETIEITKKISADDIEELINLILELKKNDGRLFVLGVGGSAANASHAANDFRKLAGIETYAPSDNIAELTARVNDEGWNTIFTGWLKVSKLNSKDGILILSVGGGDQEKNVSLNLVDAINLAKEVGAKICGIVGREGGYTAKHADVCVIIPTINPESITPHSESFQAVIWHLMVSHPKLKINPTKW